LPAGRKNSTIGNVPSDTLSPEQVARIREGLARKGWTQGDLAQAVQKRESTISSILNGSAGPRTSTLKSICEALGLNFGWVTVGLEPRWVDPKKSPSFTQLTAVPMSLGVDLWLADTPQGRSTNAAEREMLRASPWPNPHRRYEDEAYEWVLMGYRRTLNAER
jgi:transcriptional regulator with XRE-family HTH domain